MAERTLNEQWWPEVRLRGGGLAGLGFLSAFKLALTWKLTAAMTAIGGGIGAFWGAHRASKMASSHLDAALKLIFRMEVFWINDKLPKVNRKIELIEQSLSANLLGRSEIIKLEAQKTQLVALKGYFSGVIGRAIELAAPEAMAEAKTEALLCLLEPVNQI